MTGTGAEFDETELRSYLSKALGAEVVETEVLNDGLNLSIAISTAVDGRSYVLRRPNKFRQTALFNDLREEYGVLERLHETGIRAPSPVLFCENDSVLGEPFLVITYLDGAVIPLGSDLPERFRNPGSRGILGELLVETLAEIHSLDDEQFESVCDYHSPLEQVEHASDQLDDATSVTGHEIPTLRSVGDWLRRNAPSDHQTALVHGDFRPGNVLFAGDDRPEITGVLDWETAMLGDPLTELGYLLLRWRDDGDPTPSLDELEERYPDSDAIQHLRDVNENGLSPFTAKPGSSSRRELVARYEEKTGIAFEHERFYRAHAAFMLATVWEDLHRHKIAAGAESDWEPHVEYVAMVADSIVNGELEL